jgi:hypothetical protein
MLGEEKQANPFLRADVPAVAKAVGLAGQPAWKVFAEIASARTSREVSGRTIEPQLDRQAASAFPTVETIRIWRAERRAQ